MTSERSTARNEDDELQREVAVMSGKQLLVSLLTLLLRGNHIGKTARVKHVTCTPAGGLERPVHLTLPEEPGEPGEPANSTVNGPGNRTHHLPADRCTAETSHDTRPSTCHLIHLQSLKQQQQQQQ